MTKARAPGKIVLSGAYAVLAGAPAIVAAVARFVTADTAREADLVTAEVRAALGSARAAPWFDASALREGGRKLGLGSSAAILVASLFALEREANPLADDSQLRQRVFEQALSAHRLAQGGGSGVDVAASCFGGTLVYRLSAGGPKVAPISLPVELSIEIWSCPTSAATRDLLAAVAALFQRAPQDHARILREQALAAEQAVVSAERQDAGAFVTALRAQRSALSELGRAAGVGIITRELGSLGELAHAEAGVLLPAGAGGGDIALFVGPSPSSAALRAALEKQAHYLLAADLAAAGVTAI